MLGSLSTERRQSRRLSVSVPCTLNWQGQKLTGHIENISARGALINKLQVAPPVSALVAITFRVRDQSIKMLSSVEAVVVRSVSEISLDDMAGAAAVLFEDQSEETRSTLNAILCTLTSAQDSPETFR